MPVNIMEAVFIVLLLQNICGKKNEQFKGKGFRKLFMKLLVIYHNFYMVTTFAVGQTINDW